MDEPNGNINPVSKSILRTLAYYDIFSYPLTSNEIFMHANTNGHSQEDVLNEIDLLKETGLIIEAEGFFSLSKRSNIITRRIEGNKRALKKMKIAKKVCRLISHFPYIKAVFLSGSISKGFMNEKADIDYFIVAEPKRLWIARFILVMFKRIFMLNSHKYFCVNYFIDSEHLEIEEKNIYTATELVTLIPTYGSDIYEKFYQNNIWVKDFIPNFPKRDTSTVKKYKRKFTQILSETLLNNKIGDILDDKLMKLFIKHDYRNYGDFSDEDYKIAFKTRKTVSKHHPNHFQKKVLTELTQKIREIENQHNILIN